VPEDLAFSPGMGLEAALARFAFTLAVLQEPGAVERVAAEMCEDAKDGGVETLEIRFDEQCPHGGDLAGRGSSDRALAECGRSGLRLRG